MDATVFQQATLLTPRPVNGPEESNAFSSLHVALLHQSAANNCKFLFKFY
jgi:hypothetical protein